MIGDVYCIDKNDIIQLGIKKLELARSRIQEFEALSFIFGDFKGNEYEIDKEGKLSQNVIFYLASNDRYENSHFQSNSNLNYLTQNALKDLDEAIKIFFPRFPKKSTECSEYFARLTSSDNFTSIEAYNEIRYAYNIAKKIGLDKINLHHKLLNKKRPDIVIELTGVKIVLELTGLNLRQPEKKD